MSSQSTPKRNRNRNAQGTAHDDELAEHLVRLLMTSSQQRIQKTINKAIKKSISKAINASIKNRSSTGQKAL